MATAVFTSFDQQFDNNGDPLNGGSVTVYQAATTTPIQLYNDDDLAGGHETSNPITLDSSGRHAIAYFSTQSYKVLIKDSGGSTVATIDNIDPGVPVGTGALPIANGGTAATSAATALSNLGGATAAELADLAADVAALAGAAASTEKTHIATGTTAQRPASPAEGDIRRNTTTSHYEFYTGAAWANVRTDVNFTAATQADQETATSTTTFVTPGRQHFHPGTAKAWFKGDMTGQAISASYHVTSFTDGAQGIQTVNWATSFSGAHYSLILGGVSDSPWIIHARTGGSGMTASLCDIVNTDSTSTGGDIVIMGAAFGDYA